jgi:dCMP deaminase
VVAIDGRVCSTGYNGAPHGMPHCVHPVDERSADRPPTADRCATSVHAETNAIVFAAKHGVSIAGATLYTTLTPCVPCALLILNSGITRVVCAVRYRDATGVRLLRDANVAIEIRDEPTTGDAVESRWRSDSLRGQRGDGI